MNFLMKLENEMKKKKIQNLHELSVQSGIPYSTLRGFYTKGCDKIKLPTLIKLKRFFNCTLDYLVDDSNDLEELNPPSEKIINRKEEN